MGQFSVGVNNLPNGLQVHARCELRARDGHHRIFVLGKPAGEIPAADPILDISPRPANAPRGDAASPAVDQTDPASLRDADMGLIARTLKECGGNVSATARKLQVSRGLIYRRIQGG